MSAVLIVDDSPSDRALFRGILSRAGYQVYEVALGQQALAKAREVRPHAIILDVELPDTDGHSICRSLRADAQVAGIPVLMLTACDDKASILAGLGAGADDYVTKDSPSEVILARIRRLTQYRQMATVAVLNEHLVQVGRLMAGIVHEIRAPLAVIRGSAELMRYALGPDSPAMQWVDPILRNAQLLQVRLEHLMATVRGGPAVIGPVDLVPLVREAAELYHKGTDPKGAHVTFEVQCAECVPPALTDAGRLIQVLFNLFGNAYDALRDVRPDGRIRITIGTAHDQEQDWVQVEVADNGPGVPEPLLGRLFEPYFTTKEGGSGYGLYLAAEILKEQHGRLTVRNRPEGGASFTLWLPSAAIPSPQPASHQEGPEVAHRP